MAFIHTYIFAFIPTYLYIFAFIQILLPICVMSFIIRYYLYAIVTSKPPTLEGRIWYNCIQPVHLTCTLYPYYVLLYRFGQIKVTKLSPSDQSTRVLLAAYYSSMFSPPIHKWISSLVGPKPSPTQKLLSSIHGA